MNHERQSKTADQIALSRAIESAEPGSVRACHDPLARQLMAARYRPLTWWSPLRRFTVWFMERLFEGHHAYVVARTHVLDDRLSQALAEGVTQVVILGAGKDSRAYRFIALKERAVFEVDHPASQRAKLAQLRRVLGELPEHVQYVPVDLCADRLDERLPERGYRQDAPTLFLWEGTTPYITAEAVDDTLRFVASNTNPATRIVFDYILRSVVEQRCEHPGGNTEARRMASTAEPFTFGIDPAQLRPFLEQRGFHRITEMGAQALGECLYGRSRMSPVKPWWRIVTAFVCSA